MTLPSSNTRMGMQAEVIVQCNKKHPPRTIKPGEISGCDFPLCPVCYMPQLPIQARVRQSK